jgi:hypothetical protein
MFQGRFFRRIVELKSRLIAVPSLPFSDVLSQQRIVDLLKELKALYRDRLYPPWTTLWIFLGQVLSGDHSCREALARWSSFRAAAGLGSCSTDTGSYCEARKRLPLALVSRLARETGREIHQEAFTAWRLAGRPVKLVDGSTVSMPDTPDNTAAFGKPRNQHGFGPFPVARLVAVLCLATGAALELALGPCGGKKTGELSLFRRLKDVFVPDDIVLADRFYCTYCDIARLRQQGVDVVMRQHTHRKSDFRRGQRLGKDDHLVLWQRPASRPDWMSQEEFQALPDHMEMREVRVAVTIPGFRVKSLVVVTTLLNPGQFSRGALAEVYRQRWQAELDLRSIKTMMQMDVLRCKTAEMVEKEIWMHLLAYNLLRSMLCATAAEHDLAVRSISFKASLQLLNAFYHQLVTSSAEQLETLVTIILSALREHRVGNRPNRYEPRKRKRPAKPYPRMKLPRYLERKRCA